MLRFAPSPTGDMHIGDLRVAILNYLYAQQKGEEFIVRIEDIDQATSVAGKDEEILMILEKFALPHAQLYHQRENLHMHQTLAIKLLQEEKAFVCLCQSEDQTAVSQCHGNCENTQVKLAQLKEDRTPFSIHLKKTNNIEDVTLLKIDGIPTTLFATACDDMLSGVTTIIREDKHISNTPKQRHIQAMLGYSETIDAIHLPSLENDNIPSVKSLLEEGFLPDAIINYLLLLGNETSTEIFTLPQAITFLNIQETSKGGVKFDWDKLRFINCEHLKMMDDKKISSLFGFADSDIGKLAKLYLAEASTINELEAKIKPIFSKKDFSGELGKEMAIIQKIILEAPMINEFDTFKQYIMDHSKIESEALDKSLRVLITGVQIGPELEQIYTLIKSYITEVVA